MKPSLPRVVLSRLVPASGLVLIALGCATSATNDLGTTPDASSPGKRVDSGRQVVDSQVPTTQPPPIQPQPVATDLDSSLPMLGQGEPFDPTPELAEGASCALVNDVVARRCGRCGIQQALCAAQTDGGLRIGTYGPCNAENQGPRACLPGAERLGDACGLCGKMRQTCALVTNCEWEDIACEGEAVSGCTPGTVRYASLSCASPALARQACNAACGWDAPSACEARAPELVSLPAGFSPPVHRVITFWPQVAKRLALTNCPAGITSTDTNVSYARFHNEDTMPVMVDLAVGAATGVTLPSSVVALFPGSDIPAVHTNCEGRVTVAGGSNRVSNVVIPGGGDVMLMVMGNSTTLADSPLTVTAFRKPTATGGGTGGTGPTNSAIVVVPATPGTTHVTVHSLTDDDEDDPLDIAWAGACPAGLAGDEYFSSYITLSNPTAVAASVTVGIENPSLGTQDFIAAVYVSRPVTEAQTRACIGYVSDICSNPAIANDACIQAISIPAYGQRILMVSDHNNYAWSGETSLFSLKVTRL